MKSPGLFAVGGVAGLALQVAPGGSRSWVLRALVGGKRRDMGLGGYPDVPLALAREKARSARLQIDQGQDPILTRLEAKRTLVASAAASRTFEECATAYIEAKSAEWKNPKHHQQWTSTLKEYAYPVIGQLLVRDVALPHVMRILEPIWTAKTETATRVRGRIEAVLGWATVRGYRTGDNPARWRDHLDKLLAAPGKVTRTTHHRAVSLNAMADFFAALRSQQGMGARALEYLLLTAARSGEVRMARWSEVDLEAGVWVVPAERMKAGREHRVPLSKAAIKILRSLSDTSDSPLLFPSPQGKALSDMTLSAVMRRMGTDGVPHGLRSSFKDWAAERTNYPSEMSEMALAHTISDKVEAAYRRGDMFEKRRQMMNDWAKFCAKR